MVEKKKNGESRSPKPAAKKPRARKAPAVADPAIPPVSPGVEVQPAETAAVLEAAAATETAAAGTAGSNMSAAEREALKAELQNEIAQLRGMLKRAANGFINPWKMPW